MPPSIPLAGPVSPPRHIDQAIAAASRHTGVDFDYLMNQAKIESAMDPDARARTSSAVGLFQFTKQTWLATLKAHGTAHQLGWAADAITQGKDGTYRVDDPAMRASILDLRTDPVAASAMAAEFASDNASHLEAALGRTAEPVDLYLAHFLGAQGAVRFLSAYDANPDASASDLLPTAAAANRAVFYDKSGSARSVGEIRQIFAGKITSNTYAVYRPPSQDSGSLSLSWQSRNDRLPAAAEMTQMQGIEPMPRTLSLGFAAQAYQRLAAMNGGAR